MLIGSALQCTSTIHNALRGLALENGVLPAKQKERNNQSPLQKHPLEGKPYTDT